MPSSRVSEHQQQQQAEQAEQAQAQAESQGQAQGRPEPQGAPEPGRPDAAALEAEVARLEDRYKRTLADLDNFRKRSTREIERRVTEATDAIVLDWLQVADSIDRALASDPEAGVAPGLQAVADQIAATLAREGVARVGTPGERFDPERHEAIDVRVDPGAAEPTVVDVARSGYARGDRVLRPAQVVVARRPPEPPAD
jgi:molecular chaperone GrpE